MLVRGLDAGRWPSWRFSRGCDRSTSTGRADADAPRSESRRARSRPDARSRRWPPRRRMTGSGRCPARTMRIPASAGSPRSTRTTSPICRSPSPSPAGTTSGQESSPIVVGDTLYFVTPYPNILYAIDLRRSGALKMEGQFDARRRLAGAGMLRGRQSRADLCQRLGLFQCARRTHARGRCRDRQGANGRPGWRTSPRARR
jgi:hypothetical protein